MHWDDSLNQLVQSGCAYIEMHSFQSEVWLTFLLYNKWIVVFLSLGAVMPPFFLVVQST